jgi:chromosome segregation protein
LVNPLALEEFTAMEERHTFLNTQLEDLKRSRKDLLEIVAEVDERVQQVFAEAFADVQREFTGVFERLFPGGEGKLVLTEPNDLLNTGIEVEARPSEEGQAPVLFQVGKLADRSRIPGVVVQGTAESALPDG